MSSGNGYNGKVCFHWLRIYNNPPSLFGFSYTMYYDITTLKTELACNDYLSIYLAIYPSILFDPSPSVYRSPEQKVEVYRGKINVLFSSSSTGMYRDFVSSPILSTKVYSPLSLFSSIHFLVSSLSRT